MNEYNKYELFEYFKNVKNPNLCRESFFKKRFENIYEDFRYSLFYSLDLSFKERLYLYFSDDYELKLFKCKCGNKKRFHSFKDGYFKFCCHTCAANDENTKIKTKKTFDNFSEEYKQNINKRKSEKLKSYYKNSTDDIKKFLSDRCYKNFHSTQEKETNCIKKRLEKRKSWTKEEKEIHHKNAIQGQIKRTKDSWVESNLKQLKTKKKNKTITSSKLEKYFEEYLLRLNIPFKKQYSSKQYPFACDFYILDKDLYIEIQGNWTHGKHPFNPNDKNDMDIVNNWKEKNTRYYLSAIKNWTVSDPHKREIAKINKLNFLEIFPKNNKDLIQKFEYYYEQL